MALMIQQRHLVRWAVISLVLFFFILSWNLLDPQHPIRAGANRQLESGLQAIKDQLATDPTSPNPAYGDAQTLERAAAVLTQQANQLNYADDFVQHFRRVVQLPGLTVQDAASTCTWKDSEPVNFQWGADTAWNVEPLPKSVISTHRKEWQNFVLHDMIPWGQVERQSQGRGIVVLAGNQRTVLRSMVFFRALSQTQTQLPVELHYFGDGELSPQNRTDLKALFPNLHFGDLNDTRHVIQTKSGEYMNFNLKTAAVLNSNFTEVILLDSDNIPVEDPAKLFDSNVYRKFGTVFWPDIARTRQLNPAWALTNTPCRMREHEQESGQMLVDKSRFWYHLQLANYWTNQEFYGKFLLGDKDAFRFAWHALKTEYGRPARWLTSIGTVHRPRNEQPFASSSLSRTDRPSTSDSDMSGKPEHQQDSKNGGGLYCGHTFGQHHPDAVEQSHIVFLHGGLLKTWDQPVLRHEIEYGSGVFSAYKMSSSASDPGYIEPVGIKWDGGDYLEPSEKEKMHFPAHCTDFYNLAPGRLGDANTKELKDIESRLRKADVYWTLNQTEPGKWNG